MNIKIIDRILLSVMIITLFSIILDSFIKSVTLKLITYNI